VRKILLILDLIKYEKAEVWTPLFGREPSVTSLHEVLSDAFRGIFYFEHYFSALVGLLEHSEEKEEVAQLANATEIEFFINEGKRDIVKLRYIISMLDAVQDLIEEIWSLEDEQFKEILLWKIDSGSNKYFSILAGHKAIKALKETMIDIWDRIRFYEANRFQASAKAAIESCALIEKLHDLEKKGAITPAQAAKSKKTVVRSLNKLFEGGVYIEEMRGREGSLSAKQITGSNVKLIEFKSESADAQPKQGDT